LFAGLATIANSEEPTQHRFAFGNARKTGAISVLPGSLYSNTIGYGFEPGSTVRMDDDSIFSDQPFFFSVALPEGNYRVTADSSATIKSELRRLMVEKIRNPGTTTFIVNIRTPEISTNGKVRLKSRELESEMRAWDDKLTLEFNGHNPSLRSLTISPVKVPTLFIAGDSTVCDQPAEPWNSWGQMLPRFFTPTVAVANYANSGESIRSSLGAGRFDKIFSLMKPGDYLFIQFGHNDQKDKSPDALETYRGNLKKLVGRTRALGGTPVLVTSMERKSGVRQDTLGGYPGAVRSVADEEGCALIDLHAMSRTLYQALGGDLGKAFQDGTHHNNYGSYQLAKCVVAGIRQAKLPLANSIIPNFGRFEPAKPDPVATFKMPASPRESGERPLGD
jgi:lysophospholipase L1-like esterase